MQSSRPFRIQIADYISIMRLSVDLAPAEEQQLGAVAARLNIAPEALAAAALRDLADRRGGEFEAAAAHVLEKNRELYRRLA